MNEPKSEPGCCSGNYLSKADPEVYEGIKRGSDRLHAYQ